MHPSRCATPYSIKVTPSICRKVLMRRHMPSFYIFSLPMSSDLHLAVAGIIRCNNFMQIHKSNFVKPVFIEWPVFHFRKACSKSSKSNRPHWGQNRAKAAFEHEIKLINLTLVGSFQDHLKRQKTLDD